MLTLSHFIANVLPSNNEMLLWYIATLKMLIEHFEARLSKLESDIDTQRASSITSGASEEKELEVAIIQSKDVVQAAIQF